MSKLKKLLIGLILIGFGVLFLIALIKFASFLGFFVIYSYAVQKITGYGLNPYLADAIGIMVAVPLWILLFKMIFSLNDTKRKAGMIGFGLVFIIHLIVMFLIPGDALVHPVTGEVKYCTIDPLTNIVVVHEQPVYDQFGNQAKRCDFEQIQKYNRQTQFGRGENAEVTQEIVEKGFISPVTGKALFYFCQDTDDHYHFYVGPGFCSWGGQLQSVTAEVMKKLY